MRPSTKITVSVARFPLRKAAASTAAPRRAFPAWIDANDAGAVPNLTVTPRVRDGLILRVVPKGKPVSSKGASHGSGAR